MTAKKDQLITEMITVPGFLPLVKALVALQKARKTETTRDSFDGMQVSRPISVDELIELSYTDPYHMRAIKLKAETTTSIIGDEESTNPAYHVAPEELAFLDSMIVNSQFNSFREFAKALFIDYGIAGEWFAECEHDNLGRPKYLYHVPVNSMSVIYKKDAYRERLYKQETTRKTETLAAYGAKGETNTILHMVEYTPLNEFYGLPDWLAALEKLRLDDSLTRYLAAFFENGAVPDFVVFLKHFPTDLKAKKKIVEGFKNNRGVRNAHRIAVLECPTGGDIDIKPLASPLKDFDFSGMEEICKKSVITAHGVPPRHMGEVVGSIGGSSDGEAQEDSFNDLTISPMQFSFETIINRVLRDAGFKGTFQLYTSTDIRRHREQEEAKAAKQVDASTLQKAYELERRHW